MSVRAWIVILVGIVSALGLVAAAFVVVRQQHGADASQFIGKSFSECRVISPICMAREATVRVESGRVALYLLDYQLASTWQASAGEPFVAVATDDSMCHLHIEQNVQMTREFGFSKPQVYGMSVATKARVMLYYVDSFGIVVEAREVVPSELWLHTKQ